MRFTENEMVFFNSITKGNDVFGIPLKFRPQESHEEEVKKTIQGLMKKGVLASETELTKQGLLPARALECYKESQNHIIINYLHIALLEKKEAIVIIPLKNHEYEMLRLPRVAVLYLLLEKYPILRTGTVAGKEKPQVEDIDTFLRELKECKENIMVGEFQENILIREWVYFWKEDRIFEYDLNRQLKKGVDAVQIRRELLRLLAINEEVENYA
ncbi:MAG: DUF5081 family protein [Clostridiales bacterium]|nr:DUF5081 family protein [Clostridiales bacterium]